MYYLDGQRLNIWAYGKKVLHLGDAIGSVNAGIYVAKLRQLNSIQLTVLQHRWSVEFVRHLLDFIDYGNLDVSIVAMEGPDEPTVEHELDLLGIPQAAATRIYDVRYCYPKIPRAPKVKKKICYCWSAIFRARQIPYDIEKLTEVLAEEFSGYELVRLGKPMTIEEDLRALSDCYFYIGFDSGMAHLCRLMRAPLFILGEVGAFPEHACERRVIPWSHPVMRRKLRRRLRLNNMQWDVGSKETMYKHINDPNYINWETDSKEKILYIINNLGWFINNRRDVLSSIHDYLFDFYMQV